MIKLKEGWGEAKNATILDDKAEKGVGRGQKGIRGRGRGASNTSPNSLRIQNGGLLTLNAPKNACSAGYLEKDSINCCVVWNVSCLLPKPTGGAPVG